MKQLFTNAVVTLFCIAVFLISPVSADVQPGDVINKDNWQKIQDLVPDFILTWVKNGDLEMKIGKLNFDKNEFHPPVYLASLKEKTNQGKYKFNEKNELIEVATGKIYPKDIAGFPFAEPDYNSPQVGYEIAYNAKERLFDSHFVGNNDRKNGQWLIGRKGLEKFIGSRILQFYYTGDKGKYDYASIGMLTSPYNWAGFGNLNWVTSRPGVVNQRWIYAPNIRKIRRYKGEALGCESPAGLTIAEDDMWAGGPVYRFADGEYRFIEKKTALIAYHKADPISSLEGDLEQGITTNEERDKNAPKMGYEIDGWKGAPWTISDIIWVKGEVALVESIAKNKDYFYGPVVGWFDAETYASVYREVPDLKGRSWKGAYYLNSAVQTKDGKYRMIIDSDRTIYDIKRDKTTVGWSYARVEVEWKIQIPNFSEGTFTPSGFLKFVK